MRVLHLLSGAGGGSTLSTIELAGALTGLGFESHAVCHSLYGSEGERAHLVDAFEGRVVFAPLYFWTRKFRTPVWKRGLGFARQEVLTGHGLTSAARVRSIVRERRIDLVHTATAVLPDGEVVSRSLGLPHVLHVRETIGPGQPFQVRGQGRPLARVVRDPRTRLVANSEATAALVAEAMPGVPAEVIHNGLDLGRFDDAAAAHRTDRPVRVVAMVGHLSASWKRHDLFVEAAAQVARTHPSVVFRIYGHRDQGGAAGRVDELRALADELGLGDRLELPGFVADPVEVMEAIDLLVQPTSSESFGRVSVEAMAARVPVVGVAEGPLAELIEHERSGLLASSATPGDLAAAIARMIDDRELRDAAVAAAHERAWDRFSVARCAGRVAAVYEELLALGPGPGEPLVRSWARCATGRFVP